MDIDSELFLCKSCPFMNENEYLDTVFMKTVNDFHQFLHRTIIL